MSGCSITVVMPPAAAAHRAGGEVLALGVARVLEVGVHVDRARHARRALTRRSARRRRGRARVGDRGDAAALDHDVGAGRRPRRSRPCRRRRSCAVRSRRPPPRASRRGRRRRRGTPSVPMSMHEAARVLPAAVRATRAGRGRRSAGRARPPRQRRRRWRAGRPSRGPARASPRISRSQGRRRSRAGRRRPVAAGVRPHLGPKPPLGAAFGIAPAARGARRPTSSSVRSRGPASAAGGARRTSRRDAARKAPTITACLSGK